MCRQVLELGILFLLGAVLGVQAQSAHLGRALFEGSGGDSPAIPLYRVDLKEGNPISGVGAMPAIQMPFQCTGDGTTFVNMVQTFEAGTPPGVLPRFPSLLLTSISLSGVAHAFPLENVTGLIELQNQDYAVSDSEVAFLVSGVEEAKGTRATAASDESPPEDNKGAAGRHRYIVIFDRDGQYRRKFLVEEAFRPLHFALFSTGKFVAYGDDPTSHVPKLAMLNEDGTLLKFVEIPRASIPESTLMTKGDGSKGSAGYIRPVQFSTQGRVVYALQSTRGFPVLEINEAGAVKVIKPTLPDSDEITMIIPSDRGLYVAVNSLADGSIYELNPQKGNILSRLQVSYKGRGQVVACVHEGKFLSFERGGDKLVPLVGSAQPDTKLNNQ